MGVRTPDPKVDPRLVIVGVDPVHVIALLVGDHFQRQFVMVAQEERPLARLGDGRRLVENIHDGHAVLHPQGHEHPGHKREMKRHVAFITFA